MRRMIYWLFCTVFASREWEPCRPDWTIRRWHKGGWEYRTATAEENAEMRLWQAIK